MKNNRTPSTEVGRDSVPFAAGPRRLPRKPPAKPVPPSPPAKPAGNKPASLHNLPRHPKNLLANR